MRSPTIWGGERATKPQLRSNRGKRKWFRRRLKLDQAIEEAYADGTSEVD